MQATIEQLTAISIFQSLAQTKLEALQPSTLVHHYLPGEILMYEGDVLSPQLYALVSGSIRITKNAPTGKETILRILSVGEIFAAPALFGNGIAPATVIAESEVQVVMLEREALLNAIRTTPEIAFSMLSLFNQRLQQLHNTVHGLVSERAIARLIHYIQYFAAEYGVEKTQKGDSLRSSLPYYQIARSIGITYEECVRLFKQLQPVVSYSRGGKITVQNWQILEKIAATEK